MANDDWEALKSFLPANWQALAFETKALKGLRKAKNPENLLRTLLIHLVCGYSLRETSVRASLGHLAQLSDVALLKRLRKAQGWLQALCRALLAERGLTIGEQALPGLRLFDATTVKEPGRTGSLWRIHYSLSLPGLQCDFLKITATEGHGAGEALSQFPVQAGDNIVVDAGYCTAQGAAYVQERDAFVTMRFNPLAVRTQQVGGEAFDLLGALRESLVESGPVASWDVRILSHDERHQALGRLCAVRKTREAIELAHRRLRRHASKQGVYPTAESFAYAEYVIVFTTVPQERCGAGEILRWYRIRWQIELVFKRFKQLAHLGHLPKYEDESSKAWLYGKLLGALLVEKMREHARAFSPWGYELPFANHPQPMA